MSFVCASVAVSQVVRGDEEDEKKGEGMERKFVVREKDLIVSVFNWAIGSPVDFMAYKWMTDKVIVFAWGQFFARFHDVSRSFCIKHPTISQRIQHWTQLHSGVMKHFKMDPKDIAVVDDIKHHGVTHGDVNCSNFFFVEKTESSEAALCVFDFDQTHRSWYLADLSQALVGPIMLKEGGSLIDGSKVNEANPELFQEWLVDGYESIAGKGSVDLERLARMVQMKKKFYGTFCKQALEEGAVPTAMEYFLKYVTKLGWEKSEI